MPRGSARHRLVLGSGGDLLVAAGAGPVDTAACLGARLAAGSAEVTGTPGTRRIVRAADSVAVMPTRCITASGRHALVLAAVLGLLLAGTANIVAR